MTTTISGSSGGTAVTTTTLTALVPPSPPQGRLTLTSATPVLTATVSAATTIYYALYTGNLIPIYSGTAWVMTTFTELSNATAQSTTGNAGPAAVAANSNYDLFAWSNSGTLTLTRGPLWTSDTGRGTGSGTTEISRVLGIWSNTVAITNGPGAGLGTYVGTVRSNGSATIDWIVDGSGAGGSTLNLGVFNAYNRVKVAAQTRDTTSSWTYTTTTWRSMNNSNSNRINYIDGLTEVYAKSSLGVAWGGNTMYVIGVNRDSTSATPTVIRDLWNPAGASALSIDTRFVPSLGFHYLQAMEWDSGGGTSTAYGTGDPTGSSGPASAQWQALNVEVFI